MELTCGCWKTLCSPVCSQVRTFFWLHRALILFFTQSVGTCCNEARTVSACSFSYLYWQKRRMEQWHTNRCASLKQSLLVEPHTGKTGSLAGFLSLCRLQTGSNNLVIRLNDNRMCSIDIIPGTIKTVSKGEVEWQLHSFALNQSCSDEAATLLAQQIWLNKELLSSLDVQSLSIFKMIRLTCSFLTANQTVELQCVPLGADDSSSILFGWITLILTIITKRLLFYPLKHCLLSDEAAV